VPFALTSLLILKQHNIQIYNMQCTD